MIEAICRWTLEDELVVLPPEEVLRLADRYLASERVIELDGRPRRARDSITRDDGVRVDATGGEPALRPSPTPGLRTRSAARSTPANERASLPCPPPQWRRRPGGVSSLTSSRPSVRALCTSGMAVQCAIGRPGSGKTHSLGIAARAWEAAGFRVIGAAVKGEAARLLGEATGVHAETVAWWLTALTFGHEQLDDRTIVPVARRRP